MNNPVSDEQALPSTAMLIRATLSAFVIGVALLVTIILPAEYGVDPIGAGKFLGLDALNSTAIANTTEIVPSDVESDLALPALIRGPSVLRSDTLTVTVPPYEGIEVKADMITGQSFVFEWETDGLPLYTDMHGEPPNAAQAEFTRYWKENEQLSAQGTLLARFDGTHGWYWQNMTEEQVTVTLSVSGFYQGIHEK